MLKDKNIFINIVLCVWQITQIIVGIVCLAVFRNYEKYTNEYNGITVLKICHNGLFGRACFSTGPFVIVDSKNVHNEILKHETGHSKQSLYFGPIYHLLISLPSICLFLIKRITHKDGTWYHSHYPENWADRCGGVNLDIILNKS